MIFPVVQFVTYLYLLSQAQAQEGVLASSSHKIVGKGLKKGQLPEPLSTSTIDRSAAEHRKLAQTGTQTTGWYVQKIYENDDATCTDDMETSYGYQLGVCSQATASTSSQRSCTTNDDGTITVYTDNYGTTDCSGAISFTTQNIYTSACTSTGLAFRRNYCTTDAKPYDDSDGTVQYYYNDNVCEGEIDYYYWYDTNDDCVEISCSSLVYTSFETTCAGDAGEDSTCFGANEVLTLASGESKIISEVKVGDKVMVLNADNEFVFSEVIFVPHAKNSVRATFHELMTSSGKTIKATEGHLIQAGMCGSVSGLKYIEDINSADCVMTVDGEENVASTKSSQESGVYTVVTADANGKVVVNGIVASSFGTSHVVANSYYHLHRMLHGLGVDGMLAKLTTLLSAAVGKFN